jgi:hypothetical protein
MQPVPVQPEQIGFDGPGNHAGFRRKTNLILRFAIA